MRFAFTVEVASCSFIQDRYVRRYISRAWLAKSIAGHTFRYFKMAQVSTCHLVAVDFRLILQLVTNMPSSYSSWHHVLGRCNGRRRCAPISRPFDFTRGSHGVGALPSPFATLWVRVSSYSVHSMMKKQKTLHASAKKVGVPARSCYPTTAGTPWNTYLFCRCVIQPW